MQITLYWIYIPLRSRMTKPLHSVRGSEGTSSINERALSALLAPTRLGWENAAERVGLIRGYPDGAKELRQGNRAEGVWGGPCRAAYLTSQS